MGCHRAGDRSELHAMSNSRSAPDMQASTEDPFAEQRQAISDDPSYRMAHEDPALLNDEASRPIRLQLELVGVGLWRKVINFELLIEEGFISPQDVQLFTIVDTAEDIVSTLEEFYGGKPPLPGARQH